MFDKNIDFLSVSCEGKTREESCILTLRFWMVGGGSLYTSPICGLICMLM